MPGSKIKAAELTVEQERFIRLEADGMTTAEIAWQEYGMKPGSKEYHNLEAKFSRWRKHERYSEVWRDQVEKSCHRLMAKAVRRLDGQIDEKKDKWLANKAANDIMNFAKGRLYSEEDRTVHVTVEGLPDLGTPDDE